MELETRCAAQCFTKRAGNALLMRWFGFGFNGFEQIIPHDELNKEGLSEVKIIRPVELTSQKDGRDCKIRACWSRRANLYFNSKSIIH